MPNQWKDPLAYYDSLVRRFKRLGDDIQAAYQVLPEEGRNDLLQLTSGHVSSKTLAKMGHPYARKTAASAIGATKDPARRGVSKGYAKRNALKGKALRAAAPLLPINRQKGKLTRSVKITRRPAAGKGLRYSVGFDRAKAKGSIYAVLPDGTRKVVPRGLWTEKRRRWRIRNRAFRDVFVRTQRATMSAR